MPLDTPERKLKVWQQEQNQEYQKRYIKESEGLTKVDTTTV